MIWDLSCLSFTRYAVFAESAPSPPIRKDVKIDSPFPQNWSPTYPHHPKTSISSIQNPVLVRKGWSPDRAEQALLHCVREAGHWFRLDSLMASRPNFPQRNGIAETPLHPRARVYSCCGDSNFHVDMGFPHVQKVYIMLLSDMCNVDDCKEFPCDSNCRNTPGMIDSTFQLP